MDIFNSFDIAGGIILTVLWAGAVLWGLGQAALSARKGKGEDQAYLVGLVLGCGMGAGMMLALKNNLPFDTFGMGFVLVLCAGLVIWAYGHVSHQRRP